ncbi:uncharacterized protein LOC131941227 [Physella acuta]|uniref:uncharacterized protein LOC131941227 n=1 Tax=Physella acuta TaxID=109671 RepID=UPI0027DD6080|nr:uncharacterized protein LOC131941227 [Physella acuta]XP_059156297.1 uncharacterized protein LOC131941227 [Physella acuta]XP_059156299.1 uncharacterized protein LOC131941227 [Physella acuta]XP_059156300.1 uncharacterized protein LOC131941227 [Physella acuta]
MTDEEGQLSESIPLVPIHTVSSLPLFSVREDAWVGSVAPPVAHGEQSFPVAPPVAHGEQSFPVAPPVAHGEQSFPVDESAWTVQQGFPLVPNIKVYDPGASSRVHDPRASSRVDDPGGSVYFEIDENAWSGVTDSSVRPDLDEEYGPDLTFRQNSTKKWFWRKRHKNFLTKHPKLLETSFNRSVHGSERNDSVDAMLPRQQSLDVSSVTSSTNLGFRDFEESSSIVNHRSERFEHDTAMLFRSLSKPRQKKKSACLELSAVWCQRFCCSLQCCSLPCSCPDQKGVHLLKMLGQKVISHLNLVQIFLISLSIVLSGMVFFPRALTDQVFEDQCVLYSNIYLQWKNSTDVTMDLSETKFGDVNQCYFTTFLNVVVAIVSVIFLWFFLHTQNSDTTEQSEVKLQLPVLLVYFGMLICVIVSSIKISAGFSELCRNLVGNHKDKHLDCRTFQDLNWNLKDKTNFYTYTMLAEASSWLVALTLFVLCLVTCLRLYHDFVISYQEVELPHKKMSEVDDTDSLYLEQGLTNRGSEDLITTVRKGLPSFVEYNVEHQRQLLAQAILHQNILAMATGDQMPSKTDRIGPIILDTESFKKKSRPKASPEDVVDSSKPEGRKEKRKMVEIKRSELKVTADVNVHDSNINSDSTDYVTIQVEQHGGASGQSGGASGQDGQHVDIVKLTAAREYMNSRSREDGQL